MGKRGISSIIGTLLLIIITVGISASAWLFISGFFSGKFGTSFSLVDAYKNIIIIKEEIIKCFKISKGP